MHDAVVLGAGVAGLTAAYRLQRSGLDVIVLEARTRLGGRALTVPLATDRYDLGATWVWDGEDAVLSLLRELDVGTFPEADVGDDVWEAADSGVVRARFPRSAVPQWRLRGGAGALVDALAARVRHVETASRVVAIEGSNSAVEVVTETGQRLRARHVVAALPPSLLTTRVQVDDLPGDIQTLLPRVPVWMGDIAKVVAVYPSAFWREDGLSGRAASRLGPMVEVHDMSGPPGSTEGALFGFAPLALATGGWRSRLVPQLVRLFGTAAGAPSEMRVQAWWDERDTVPEPTPTERLHLLGDPRLREPLLAGRLHLASTETADRSPGHLEGAVARAEQVAALIVSRG